MVTFWRAGASFFTIARSGLSIKVNDWVKVKVTGYYHISMLSATVA